MNGTAKILVVDDEDSLRVSLAANLELEGYEVVEAADGARAVDLVREQAFDLVITDVRMPGIDGVEAFRRMRRIRPDLVVVLMTAFSLERLLEEALDEGVYTVVTKPFAVDRVMGVVSRAVRRKVILVVDDKAEHAEAVAHAFCGVGLAAAAVNDGATAVGLVQRGCVDVCVIELVMPGMDGLRTCEEIRRIDPSIAIIAVSGHTVPEMMHRIMSLGGYACLRKPFAMGELLRATARARGGAIPRSEVPQPSARP